ncbi:DUF5678 domain-containing protein [Fulvivirgaceae bacterium BMA10]|uniref:DUF5678 domain-containing protein n=1 Tax=Splendidivirga corallicola TaxID=3051826 RepID=A0ABT8KQ04_9BACT|nr:DUF5678 domain-containing protein [Fulvivirgaceae bacterium BMA10]
MLEKEFQYYLDNQDDIVEKYDGKHIIIVGEEIIAAFDSLKELFAATKKNKKKYVPGTYLIQKVSPGDKDYTATFHSRTGNLW